MKKRFRKSKVLSTAKNLEQEFRKGFRTHIATAITAGFAFLIALVWRDAIQEGINAFIVNMGIQIQQAYLYKIYSAILITIVCVMALVLFSKWGAKKS
ncbi:MAG: hypothetical protein IB618_03070 [Candidatus Pacearchaeota archaeon]|nr:MAG: hypothetical protein IB618_03070 [Candidatus Pacearchaeota archaeon]